VLADPKPVAEFPNNPEFAIPTPVAEPPPMSVKINHETERKKILLKKVIFFRS
jgi:hypothetical protein